MRFAFWMFLICGLSFSVFGQSGNPADVNISNLSKVDSTSVISMVDRSDSLARVGKIRQAISLLRRSAAIADSLGNDSLIQSVNIQQAANFLNNDQPDSAEIIINKTLKEYPDTEKKAELLSLLGNAYRYQGRYKEALNRQQQAKALVDSARNPETYGRLNHNIGAVHSNTGNYGTAFTYYLQSIEIAEATADSVLLAKGLNSLGVAYNNNSEPEKAKHHLERAIEINKSINNRVGLLHATNNLAISFDDLGEVDRAIEMYDRALQLQSEIRKDVPPFRILYNLGQLYKKNDELDKAEEHYKKSLEYCEQAGIPQGLIYNYGGLANVAELRGNFPMARSRYKKALQIAQKINNARLEQDALQSLYNLERNLKNYREALSYHETLVAVKESLENIKRRQELEEAEAKLGMRRQEEINQLLQEKQKQQQARITTQNWLIAASVTVILVVLISLYLLYRSNSEKRKINFELADQRNKLEELNEVKDKMLAILSHDLRSPMASIKGMLYLLREGDLSHDETVEQTEQLEVAVDQNINMLDNLLAWARDQMSGIKADIQTIEPYQIADEVVDSYQLQSHNKGVTVTNDIPQHLKVEADANLLTIVLRNLLSNSIKFSNQGDEITIRARSEQEGEVTFEVMDTGIGIPKEKRDKLFSSTSVSRSGTQNEKGSGLGLQLCKEFIEKQNGEINVESIEGEGTTFYFSLPKVS